MKLNKQSISHIKTIFILFIIYIIAFILLERINTSTIVYTETYLDSLIPFNEFFIIFYISWYVYIFLGFIYFVFQNDFKFKRTCFYMFSGMFISLIIYFIFPTGQNLRVNLNNENICQFIISLIYTVDTPTNVCPSIHVYNSIMMYISLYKNSVFDKNKLLQIMLFILVILICLSTLFIKQHAFIDVIAAIVLCIVIYLIGKFKFQY